MKKILFILALLMPFILSAQPDIINFDPMVDIDSTWQSIELDTLYFSKDSTHITGDGDTIKIVVDDQEALRLFDNAGTAQALFGAGSAAKPSISFISNPTTGFFQASDQLSTAIAGIQKYTIDASRIRGQGAGNLMSITFGSVSSTVPLYQIKNDENSGIGWAGPDSLSLIAGGKEIMRLAEGGGDGFATINGALAVSGVITGGIPISLVTATTLVITDLDSCRGMYYYNNNAVALDVTLPGAAEGLYVGFYDRGGAVITVDLIDDTDIIELNGTPQTAGHAIDSPGNAGDFIWFVAIDDTHWTTQGRSGVWVAGGVD